MLSVGRQLTLTDLTLLPSTLPAYPQFRLALPAVRTHQHQDITMDDITRLEDLLNTAEEEMLMYVEKPSTRVQACQLLAKSKQLRTKVEEYELPDLEAEYTDEEGERLDAVLEKYNEIRQGLADTQAKAETLCVCWNKLDQDMTELTAALTNGGGSKITMDRLEQSINTLKSLFIERQTTIEVGQSSIISIVLSLTLYYTLQELTPANTERDI